MEKPLIFFGTKLITAIAMNRAEYNEYRGWDLPENENGGDDGFLVEYADGGPANDPRHEGYISWSPAETFHGHYRSSGALNFGHALEALKRGHRVARSDWNGKGMFIYLVPAASYPAHRGAAKRWAGEDAMIPYGAYLAMKTATDEVVPWLASQTDVLAEDWCIVD